MLSYHGQLLGLDLSSVPHYLNFSKKKKSFNSNTIVINTLMIVIMMIGRIVKILIIIMLLTIMIVMKVKTFFTKNQEVRYIGEIL